MDLVSVCIPCYNASRFITQTLDSIYKQTYPAIELIIIDDFSTDDTFKVMQEWAHGKNRVRIFKNESNLGLVKTVNNLLNKCQGAYVQFLGHDDILLENKIEQQVKILKDLPDEVALVYSNVSVIDEEDRIIKEDYLASHGYDSKQMKFVDITAELLAFNFVPAISVLSRTACLKKAGGFDQSLSFEDLDMWIRLSLTHSIIYFPEVTALYRRNKNSQMHNDKNKVNIHASVLDCREKYRGLRDEWDKIINKGIVDTAPYLYRYHHPSGKYWLSRRLQYDNYFKSWVYWIMSKFNSRVIWRNK